MIEIADASEAIMDDLEISFLEGKISKNIVKNDDTISGYLAGAFLAAGSVNSPVTSNYHLEIALNSENYVITKNYLPKLVFPLRVQSHSLSRHHLAFICG